jgi:triacylglycerol esterase/lipase EstA (alpha/beta hydrolase family)
MSGDAVPGQVSTVFLVHGTSAQGAPWIRPDSKLATAIATAYPNVRIVPFDWSGDNSHQARVTAGHQLASRIRQVMEEIPESRIAIIGHSHGGNVALYALRDKAVAALVSEVIFLGTPFFRFVRRDVRPTVNLFALGVGY